MSAETDGLVELGTIISLPERLATSRPDGAGGHLLTIRPNASSTEIVAALMLLPPGATWKLPALGERDDTLHLMFADPDPAGG